jgi:DNA polymerase-3 subunit beta
MEFTIAKEELYKGLQRAQGVVSTKGALPILANVLIEATNEGVNIFATNLDIGVRGSYAAAVTKSGRITSQAKKLHDIVKELPDGDIVIKLDDDNRLRVACGKSKFNLATIAADEFPDFPDFNEAEEITIDAELMVEMIRKTSYAISQDETRMTLNGAFLEIGQSKVTMVATDGHRLAFVQREGAFGVDKTKKAIIARKAITELLKLVSDAEDGLRFALRENHIMFRKGGVTMVIRLIEGVFPNYEQVIPKTNSIEATIGVGEFTHALRRVATLSDEKSHMVRISFSDGSVELSSEGGEFGEAKDELEITYTGEPVEVGLNAFYLLDALATISSEQVKLKMNDALSPVLVASPDDPGHISIVMPMRL